MAESVSSLGRENSSSKCVVMLLTNCAKNRSKTWRSHSSGMSEHFYRRYSQKTEQLYASSNVRERYKFLGFLSETNDCGTGLNIF